MSKEQTPTAHIQAKYGQIADVVIMAGDPLRAKFMAENFLESPELYNQTRGMLGYTGKYNGKRVSVQGHGMGIPSIGIYSYELFNFYDVHSIIRVGTAGAFHPDLNIGDLVFAMGACSDSNFGHQYSIPGNYSPIADFELLKAGVKVADMLKIKFKVGNILSTDVFYDESGKQNLWSEMGVLAVEMEAAALYINAARYGKKALTICTISDQIIKKEYATSTQREKSFTNMMKVALEII